jgi:hypothetical protein
MPGSTSVTFYGAPHNWSGYSVSVFAAGLYCGEFTIQADGSVVVPYGSDPGGFFTGDKLYAQYENPPAGGWGPLVSRFTVWHNSADVAVALPVIMGWKYASKGQLLAPDLEQEMRSPEGPGPGKLRRAHWYSARMVNTIYGSVKFGTDFTHQFASNFQVNPDGSGGASPYNVLWSGTWRDVVDDTPTPYGSALTWEGDDPYPCTIVSLSGFLGSGEI